MCGITGKECAICYCSGGCIAAMLDDYWQKATKEQLIERIRNGEYKDYIKLMIKALKEWYDIDYDSTTVN